jgi:predicted nucleic acid-binding protein
VPNTILIDAGPLIALFDTDDRHHRKTRDFLKKHAYQYISTIAVITEVSHMLDFNTNAQQDFYGWVMYKGVILSDINQNDMPRIMELTNKYADLPMDFADATLVVTAEKTGIREIITLDKDFDIYRLPGHKTEGRRAEDSRIRNVYK